MIGNIIKKVKTWKKNREINRWYNWEFLEYVWVNVAESDTHIYKERYSKFINVYTGDFRFTSPYYSRHSRRKKSADFQIILKENKP